MDLRLNFLQTFAAQGSDGATYKVCAYDRLAPDVSFTGTGEHWESTGQVEYRLADGRPVDVQRDGTLCIARTDVVLTQAPRAGRQ